MDCKLMGEGDGSTSGSEWCCDKAICMGMGKLCGCNDDENELPTDSTIHEPP